MLYPHFPENYLPCSKFAIFLPTNFSEEPNNDIELGRFGVKKKLFVLPKGLLVKDVSATGMDYFEPNRFKIIVTSEQDNLVDYTIDQKAASANYGEYYSANSNQ